MSGLVFTLVKLIITPTSEDIFSLPTLMPLQRVQFKFRLMRFETNSNLNAFKFVNETKFRSAFCNLFINGNTWNLSLLSKVDQHPPPPPHWFLCQGEFFQARTNGKVDSINGDYNQVIPVVDIVISRGLPAMCRGVMSLQSMASALAPFCMRNLETAVCLAPNDLCKGVRPKWTKN